MGFVLLISADSNVMSPYSYVSYINKVTKWRKVSKNLDLFLIWIRQHVRFKEASAHM